MNLFFNIGFAWVSVILTFILSIILVLRLLNKKNNGKISFLSKTNRLLRKNHKLFGILLVATGLIHGLFSSQSVLSINLGTLCWVLSILLGINWVIRKRFKKKKWIYYHRILTGSFILVLVIHIINVGGFLIDDIIIDLFDKKDELNTPQNIEYKIEDDKSENNNSHGNFNDGVYYGEAEGFRPGLKVQVIVEEGRITKVEVIEHNEVNQRFWGKPVEMIPQQIVQNQSTEVDVISGATYTSKGIINAVNDALNKAIQ